MVFFEYTQCVETNVKQKTKEKMFKKKLIEPQ